MLARRERTKKQLFAEMSAPQREKLDQWKSENAATLANSGLYKAMYADFTVDAPPAGQKVPKVGRNDQCPCGSGKKYKKCCQDGGM